MILSALYFVGSGWIAARRLLWYDELWTHYISRTPQWKDTWDALSILPDFVPPLSFFLTRLSFSIFGFNEFATRFPNLIGFWLGGVCLYAYCRKKFSDSSALYTFLFLLLSGLYSYSYEARPYGLLIGFSSAAFYFWHSYAEGRKRMLIPLALSIAFAVSVHYYGVFVIIPIIIGELVRFRFAILKAIPILVTAILSASLPILLFFPLIVNKLGYASTFWAKPRWAGIWETYTFILGPAVWAIAIVALIFVFSKRRNAGGWNDSVAGRFPRHELVAVIVFACVPLIGVILGKTLTNAYSSRYGIHAVIGLAILFTAFAHKTFPSRNRTKVWLLVVLSCFFLVRQIQTYRSFAGFRSDQDRTFAFLRSQQELPVAVADPRYFFQLSHYAPPDLSSRLVYLASPAYAKKYAGDSMLDDGLMLMREIAPIRIEPFESFRGAGRPFLIYWNPGPMAWLLNAVLESRCPLELKAQSGFQFLYYCKG